MKATIRQPLSTRRRSLPIFVFVARNHDRDVICVTALGVEAKIRTQRTEKGTGEVGLGDVDRQSDITRLSEIDAGDEPSGIDAILYVKE